MTISLYPSVRRADEQAAGKSFRPGRVLLAALVAALLCSLPAKAQITLSGEVASPLTLTTAELDAMPHTEVKATDHDGKKRRYSGIPLTDLLKRAGVAQGAQLRGKNLTKYLLVKAADGYEAVFALPELDPEFADRPVLLVDKADGEPLPKSVGPYRLVVPGEKKQARWVRQVTVLEVRNAKMPQP
ncbi:molybdopterin-dependent oxidoreductase [Tellurirhabdus rosea]|uniref:molybdopterin-dependent oxidoreductase n=1 Tax=Tellurirhabdus rosea TaxID=2674997 RepID=UPI00225B964F|nr:molybdopterin-dependent oxidoreductase [Tellurirhabdus rosea]